MFGNLPLVTRVILYANLAVFALMVGLGGSSALMRPSIETLLQVGANFGPLTMSGEYWRLITCMFVHIGLLHLLMNMWVLWNIGPAAEAILGRGRYLALYLIAGLGGSLTSMLFNPSVVSAGASGAIFGVAGALLAIPLLYRNLFPEEVTRSLRSNMLFFLALNIAFGFMIPGIDNAAHIGGLITGAAAGAVLVRFRLPRR